MLDAPVAAVERVEELRDVADRIHAGLRRLEALVDDDAAADVETGLARELDVRLDADPRDDQVGVRRDLGRLELQVDAVLAVALVQRLGQGRRLQRREDERLADVLPDLHAELRQRRGHLHADEAAADDDRGLGVAARACCSSSELSSVRRSSASPSGRGRAPVASTTVSASTWSSEGSALADAQVDVLLGVPLERMHERVLRLLPPRAAAASRAAGR